MADLMKYAKGSLSQVLDIFIVILCVFAIMMGANAILGDFAGVAVVLAGIVAISAPFFIAGKRGYDSVKKGMAAYDAVITSALAGVLCAIGVGVLQFISVVFLAPILISQLSDGQLQIEFPNMPLLIIGIAIQTVMSSIFLAGGFALFTSMGEIIANAIKVKKEGPA